MSSSSESKSVTYSSTRGCPSQHDLSFREVVMRGLAHDRGLFVPNTFPSVTKEEVESWRSLSYADLAVEVIGKYVKEDEVPREKLADIVTRSCAAFRAIDVTPVVDVGGHMVLVSPNFPRLKCAASHAEGPGMSDERRRARLESPSTPKGTFIAPHPGVLPTRIC